MTRWSRDELEALGAADEVAIAPRKRDGRLQRPVTIWIVRVGDDLYVRSWRGTGGAWFRAAQAQQRGRLLAGDIEREVDFVAEPDPAINARVDAAYRAKYREHEPYVTEMVAPTARATTLKLVPR
ncbi:DUF2255 family protein [Kallotenue papyrolyticum]|uniref:DUF2255 family protein n=1 Tax=Kallotenue papyrolyticum TaxID=1325125 RepID=UPI00047866CB|nr:DUF2255 family protein [Kallotenue papyrolyticum]